MKNYADKPDEEINIEVAELRGVNWWLPPSNSSSGGWEYCKVPELMTGKDCKLPDYCNNWADAGQVMVENGISIIKCTNNADDWSAEKITDIYGKGTNMFECLPSFSFNCKNPLRAAMIVFLMMKDAER